MNHILRMSSPVSVVIFLTYDIKSSEKNLLYSERVVGQVIIVRDIICPQFK